MIGIITRVDYEMDMVGHQTIRVNLTTKLSFPFLERIEIKMVILITGENDLSVMAALDYMMWTIREDETGLSRHEKWLTTKGKTCQK